MTESRNRREDVAKVDINFEFQIMNCELFQCFRAGEATCDCDVDVNDDEKKVAELLV